MSDIILAVIVGILIGVGLFYIGIKIAVAVLINRLRREIDSLADAVETADSEKIACRVEQHNQEFFVYNNETNEFMAQGKDLAELRQKIRDRWANQKVSLVEGDDHVLEQLRTQLNESSSSK